MLSQTQIEQSPSTVPKSELPYPLTISPGHRVRAYWNLVVTFLWIALVVYFAVKVIAGGYFLLLETYGPITASWHQLVPDSTLRHDIRDVGEGYYATITAQMVVWNHWRPKGLLSRYTPFKQIEAGARRIEFALHIPTRDDNREATRWSLLLGVVLTFGYAVPGFIVGRWLVTTLGLEAEHLHHAATSIGAHVGYHAPAFWDTEVAIYSSRVPQKLIGVCAAFFFGRRPARALYDDIQAYAAKQHVASGRQFSKAAQLFLPSGFIARCNVQSQLTSARAARSELSQLAKVVWLSIGMVNVILFGIGLYVLHHVAKP